MAVISLKVASNSSVSKVAGSITKSLAEGSKVEIITCGAGSLNQAIKAVATARGYVAQKGQDLYIAPGFTTIDIDGMDKTAIKLSLVLDK